jgi:phage terminase small subunit
MAGARKYWDLLAPDLIAQRVLTAWDAPMFTAFCNAAWLYEREADEVESAPTGVTGSRGTVLNPAFRVLDRAEAQMRMELLRIANGQLSGTLNAAPHFRISVTTVPRPRATASGG